MDAQILGGAAIVLGVSVLYGLLGLHQVPEGHVGVYWQFGRLMPTVTNPGMHFTWPAITKWEAIQITMQTDKVKHIPCGTKGGTMVTFERIEVVNRLKKEAVYAILAEYGTQYDRTWIYDKVHHEINQFCSTHSLQEVYIDKFNQIDEIMQQALQDGCKNHAAGLEIIAVRVTKPKVPDAVLRNYEAMEEQRTKAAVAEQTRRLVTIEAETRKQREMLDLELKLEKERMEAESRLNVTRVENTIRLESEKAESDAAAYRLTSQAKANEALHTPQYLSLQWASALANTTKVYFGPGLNSLMAAAASAADSFGSLMPATKDSGA